MESEVKKVEAHVSEQKKKRLSELSELIQSNKTILLVSIKDIPGSQFQEIVKNLRGCAVVKVPKKSLITRALKNSKVNELEKIKEKIDGNIALLFSDADAFDLAADLVKNKKPSKAKPGEEAPEDIEIPEGPTDLIPGPAITELGNLGVPIKIEKGKIHITKSKVIVKKGDEISKQASEIMNKLNIKPFLIGFSPLCALDNENGKFYNEINIDIEKTVEELKKAFRKALPFAIEIEYMTPETITFVLGKAGIQEKTILTLIKKERSEKSKKENEKESKKNSEEKTEESVEEKNEKKEESEEEKGKVTQEESEKKSKEENKNE